MTNTCNAKELAITGLCHPWQEAVVVFLALSALLTGFFFLTDPKGMWQLLYRDTFKYYLLRPFGRFLPAVIAPPTLDDNEGYERKALDNTWKLDIYVEPIIVMRNGERYIENWAEFAANYAHGYMVVNGQRMRADTVLQSYGQI